MTRKAKLTKYIPDISRSLFGLLEGMRQRQSERGNIDNGSTAEIIQRLGQGEISETTIQSSLTEAIVTDIQSPEATASRDVNKEKRPQNNTLYILPLCKMSQDSSNDIQDALFSFRPIAPVNGIQNKTADIARIGLC